METRGTTRGTRTFLEHWWITLLIPVIAGVATLVLKVLSLLYGATMSSP